MVIGRGDHSTRLRVDGSSNAAFTILRDQVWCTVLAVGSPSRSYCRSVPAGDGFRRTVRPFASRDTICPLAIVGTLLLWFGWFGFNGGSLLEVNNQLPGIIVKMTLAGVSGMLTSLVIGWYLERRADVLFVMNGSLAGLVAITAGCDVVSTPASACIGALGAVAMIATKLALERLRIDDVVDAIPVHAGAGVLGTLAVGLFGSLEQLHTGLSRTAQIGVQGIGIVVCFLWAFGLT